MKAILTSSNMFSSPLEILTQVLLYFQASSPVVTLRQGTYTGAVLHESGYDTSVNAFLGIPYAQPPVGDLRLRPLVAVNASHNNFDATRYGLLCPQSVPGHALDTGGTSEDCLTINVFQPTGVDLTNKKIPVAVNIHGGGFNFGAGKYLNVSKMVSWSAEPFIGVSLNYRLGVLGFPSSTIAAQEGLLNLGMKDMIHALQWIQDNIAEFGGDPERVTIFGPSAGGHAVGHLMMNHQGDTPALFHRVIIEDGAPTARSVPSYDDAFVKQQFDEFLQLVECADLTSPSTFQCLRALPSDSIVEVSVMLYAKYSASVQYPFQPVIDGEVIQTKPTLAWQTNEWDKMPIMTGFSTDEGSLFIPSSMNTSEEFTAFFATHIPAFTSSDFDELNTLYPDPLSDSASAYVDARPIPVGSQFKRATAAYGHSSYICNVYTTGYYASQSAPVWEWNWALNTSLQAGAAHASHTPYESYELSIRDMSTTQDTIAQYVTAYWTSFIVSGDPNKVRIGLGKERPHWGTVDSGEGGRIMVLGRGNDERAGGDAVGTVAQMERNDEFERECGWWNARWEKQNH